MDYTRIIVGIASDTYCSTFPVSVIIGLVCGKPFEKLNHKIEENKEDSGLCCNP